MKIAAIVSAIIWSVLYTIAALSQTVTYHGTLTLTTVAHGFTVGAWCAGTACAAVATDVTTNDAYLTVETNAIRWWADGTVPTATTGHRTAPGVPIVLHGHATLVNFSAISETGTAVVIGSIGRP